MYNKEFKGDVCSHKHSFFLDNFFRRLIQPPGPIVKEFVRPGHTVVDLGCGPGYFSLEMACLVGDGGQVICVDLQREMLAIVGNKAGKRNLSHRIRTHQCTQDRIGLGPDVQADFILAFYMVHETPDPAAFLAEVKTLLKTGGRFLVIEPRFHVSKSDFRKTLVMAEDAGLKPADYPKGGLRALFTK